MKVDQEIVQQIFSSVAPELWWLLLQSCATVVVCIALYKLLNSIVSYFYVRWDKELGKRVGVVIDGRRGYIAHITFRHIIVKFDEDDDNNGLHSGNDILIPITQAGSRTWEIIRPTNSKK